MRPPKIINQGREQRVSQRTIIEQGIGPALFSSAQFLAEKKPRRNGAKSMGGNAPMGRRSCYLSRRIGQSPKSQPLIDCARAVAGSPHFARPDFCSRSRNKAAARAL